MNRSLYSTRRLVRASVLPLLFAAAVPTACGSGSTSTASDTKTGAESTAAEVGGVRVVSPQEGEAILETSDPELVVLDVRTPDEYAEGHLPGATLVDFNAADFHEQLDALDKDKDYLVYCRSGNRSGQAREMMADMGFSSVADLDGGIVAWEADGYSLTTE